jgi:histidinol dehydrogenase
VHIYKNLPKLEWSKALVHPVFDSRELEKIVYSILQDVKVNGDKAIKVYTEKFDNTILNSFEVLESERIATQQLASELKEAILQAKKNISAFHSFQAEISKKIETMPGVVCWRKSVPIESVGLYVPGGNAPLFSTVLMLGIPAVLAGCSNIIMCTPPGKDGRIHPAILYAAELVGIKQIFKVGGVQAIAAMAYGTESIPKVNKILGPGNQYVNQAKQLINRDGIAIDLPAGPSEVLVLADETADPAFVAADLLAQAEHGHDSHCLLVTTFEPLLTLVEHEIGAQANVLTKTDLLKKSITNIKLILLATMDEAVEFSNLYAPEHLIISTKSQEQVANKIINAGSVFLGNLTPVSVGDYASGTNHTLPTNGAAAAYSGVSVDSFVKKITFQELSKVGLQNIGPIVEIMAKAEGLEAHSTAVSLRLKSIND